MRIFATSVPSTSDTLCVSGAMQTFRKGCSAYCSARSTQNTAPVPALESSDARDERRVETAIVRDSLAREGR